MFAMRTVLLTLLYVSPYSACIVACVQTLVFQRKHKRLHAGYLYTRVNHSVLVIYSVLIIIFYCSLIVLAIKYFASGTSQ